MLLEWRLKVVCRDGVLDRKPLAHFAIDHKVVSQDFVAEGRGEYHRYTGNGGNFRGARSAPSKLRLSGWSCDRYDICFWKEPL